MQFPADSLDSFLARCLHECSVPGASIAVWRRGRIESAAAGIANVTTGVELTADAVMHIGSITKVVNATLVMQLVDEGLLDLDSPLEAILPNLLLGDNGAPGQITLRMLLNHTSGIDGSVLPDYGHDHETIEQGIARCRDLGQLFTPGAEFSYCNIGMVIAGYAAQSITGRSWYGLVQDRIFRRLGLRSSVTLPEEALLHRASVGHFFDPQSRIFARSSRAFNPLSRSPAGTTLMMSASDLADFAAAHIAASSGRGEPALLSRASAIEMQRVHVDNEGKGYDCGINMGLAWKVLGDGILFHGGGGPGIVSSLYACPEQQWAVAILTNGDTGLELINRFMGPWLGYYAPNVRPYGMATTAQPTEAITVEPEQYIGQYEDVYLRYQIRPGADGLLVSKQAKFALYDTSSTSWSEPAALLPLGKNQFAAIRDYDGHDCNAWNIYAFRQPANDGRMTLLGNSACLYRRVED